MRKIGFYFLLAIFTVLPQKLYSKNKSSIVLKHAKWILTDPYQLFAKNHYSYEFFLTGIIATSTVLMPQKDKPRLLIKENYPENPYHPVNICNYAGSKPVFGAMVLGYGLSVVLGNNTKLQDAMFTSIQTVLYSQITTSFIKLAVGRDRPNQTSSTTSFKPFSGNSSFPSGHVVTAFSLATPIFLYYPNLATASLFIIATGTAIARIGQNKHWSTDVLASSGIGFVTGYYLTHIHKHKENKLTVNPVVYGNKISVSVKLNLPIKRGVGSNNRSPGVL